MVISLIGFGIASALGGLAWAPWVLYTARALQGIFGAVMAPAVLALVTIGYHGRDRRIALGVLSGAQALGLAGGLVLGGVLTQYLSWRWCLLVNVPIALPAAYLLRGLVPESRAAAIASYDAPGAIVGTLGLIVLVFGVSRVPQDGWGSTIAIGCFIAAAILLTAFLAELGMAGGVGRGRVGAYSRGSAHRTAIVGRRDGAGRATRLSQSQKGTVAVCRGGETRGGSGQAHMCWDFGVWSTPMSSRSPCLRSLKSSKCASTGG
jgi:MFS family permease